MSSLVEGLKGLPQNEREAFLKSLSPRQRAALLYAWGAWGRPDQILPPGDWVTWLILAGRGWGKTRVGAETCREWVKTSQFVNLIGATADDARDIMIEGESGILAICPRAERPLYKKSERKLVWPNGATSLIFTADEPERLRGKQHGKLWADELAAWRYPEAWDQASFGLRLGNRPQSVVTTTPRPSALVKALLADPSTHVTRGSTYDNKPNLAGAFLAKIITKYEGTRLGRQELNAEILDDNPGALWKRAQIDATRVLRAPDLSRIVVGVDPAVSSKEDSDLTGIVSAGRDNQNPPHFYVLEDSSKVDTPMGWATQVVKSYHAQSADRIVGEVNNGGDLVETVIRAVDPNVAYTAVHATRGKAVRAEPVAALYEQGRVHHVGAFAQLEDEMCDWDPLTSTKSPDRMDALVWALTELSGAGDTGLLDYMREMAEAMGKEKAG